MEKRIALLTVCLLVLFGGRTVLSAPPAPYIKTMAGITLKMAHYPTAEEKTTLTGIAADSSAREQVRLLARAISTFEHKVAEADKAGLQKILGDATATADEKDLARILLNMSHMPDQQAKTRLQAMAK